MRKVNPLLIGLLVLAVAVRLSYALFLDQTIGAAAVDQGDYVLYISGALHILEHGNFNNSLFLPRPPLFPLIVALLGVDAARVLFVNAVVGGLTLGFVWSIGQRLKLSRAAVALGCLWFALDPLAINKGAVLLDPVPFSVFGITGMIACLLALWQATSAAQAWRAALAAAALFALAVLSRPESFLIWTGLGAFLLWMARRWWPMIVSYMGLCALVVAAWTFHNGQVFNYPTFSTVSGFTMVYYRANSVERLATGRDIHEINLDITRRIEARLGNDPDQVDRYTMFSYHAATPQISAALTQVAFEIFRTYPVEYVLTMGLGALRLYGLWPEQGQLVDWLRVVYNAGLVGLALLGWGKLARQRWREALLIFLIVGYYTAGVLLVKNAALEGRERAVLNPYLTLCAANAALALAQRLRHARFQSSAGLSTASADH